MIKYLVETDTWDDRTFQTIEEAKKYYEDCIQDGQGSILYKMKVLDFTTTQEAQNSK